MNRVRDERELGKNILFHHFCLSLGSSFHHVSGLFFFFFHFKCSTETSHTSLRSVRSQMNVHRISGLVPCCIIEGEALL